jgi:hypothetical protein
MKLHNPTELVFSFTFLLALGAIVDLHVKLRCPNVEVEGHEEALMDVVVFRKARPPAPEVLFAVAIVPHLHRVRDTSARLLAKNSLSQLATIHKLGEIQRQALNLTALPHGNAEKGEDSRRSSGSGRSRRRRSSRTWSGASHLGLVLTTRWTAGTALSWSVR